MLETPAHRPHPHHHLLNPFRALASTMGGGYKPGNLSTGRGGAGNIGRPSPSSTTTTSLETPTLKQPTYTTGRGGSGNIAANTSPSQARLAQDIGPVVRHEPRPGEVYHHGRGGDGNVVKTPRSGSNGEVGKTGRSGSGGVKTGRSGSGGSGEGEGGEKKERRESFKERRESFKERRDSFREKSREVLEKFRRGKEGKSPEGSVSEEAVE